MTQALQDEMEINLDVNDKYLFPDLNKNGKKIVTKEETDRKEVIDKNGWGANL